MWKWRWRDFRFRPPSWICGATSDHHLGFPVMFPPDQKSGDSNMTRSQVTGKKSHDSDMTRRPVTGNSRWCTEMTSQIQDISRNRKSLHFHFHIQKSCPGSRKINCLDPGAKHPINVCKKDLTKKSDLWYSISYSVHWISFKFGRYMVDISSDHISKNQSKLDNVTMIKKIWSNHYKPRSADVVTWWMMSSRVTMLIIFNYIVWHLYCPAFFISRYPHNVYFLIILWLDPIREAVNLG